jgi:uncharacterized membrane protein YjjP (DUF1212 family)
MPRSAPRRAALISVIGVPLPGPADPDPHGHSEPDPADLQQFLLYLGSALTSAGEAVNKIEERLHRVAAHYGAPHARITVLPTYLVVSLTHGAPATLEPTHQLRGKLRLDQTAAVFNLLKLTEGGEISPAAGIRRLHSIVHKPPRFRAPLRVAGHVVLTVGICLILQPTRTDLGLAVLFGLFIGLFKLATAHWTDLQAIVPVIAAFLVTAATLALADATFIEADLRAMIAPLVTFIPGAILTTAVVELSAAEMITGASRLIAGSMQLLLLSFGIIGAAQTVGAARAVEIVNAPENSIGAWAPWLGAMIVAIGHYLVQSGPRGSLRWLCLVLYAGWTAEYLGDLVLGGYMSGFIGAVVLTIVAYLVERRPTGPPALVSFLPGFWLLAPGSLSLIGITEYLSRDSFGGVEDMISAAGAMISISLGVLCGYPLYRALERRLNRRSPATRLGSTG